MGARFSIDVDVVRDLVRVTLAGTFAPADVARLIATRDTAHEHLRCAPNRHVTLVDIRTMRIQEQDTVAAFRQMLADPHKAARRLAFVVSPSLARLQARRAAGDRVAMFFTTIEDAERWVLAAAPVPTG